MKSILNNYYKITPTNNRTTQQIKMYTRSNTTVCKTMKEYLVTINSAKCGMCQVMLMNAMYDYMLSDKVKHILLCPRFANFISSVMKKSDELRLEADQRKSNLYMDLWCMGGQERYNEYNKLIEKSLEMMMFLEDNGVPSPYASSKSPTKRVKPVSIRVKVLPRRSARLMAKNA